MSQKISRNKEYTLDQARDALLKYFGSQIRTHATNILGIIIGIFSYFQVYSQFEFVYLLHSLILSFLITILIWQVLRLFYYSYLSSNVLVADPVPEGNKRYATGKKVSILKRLYDGTEDKIEQIKGCWTNYIRRFRTLRRARYQIMFIFLFIFGIILFSPIMYRCLLQCLKEFIGSLL